MEHKENESQQEIDWENRTLCVDESCIGVIGSDGRCKECGKPFASEQKQDPPSATDDDASSYEKYLGEDAEDESASGIDWENRTLCIDESCIGVIGPDGCCKECGKPFQEG